MPAAAVIPAPIAYIKVVAVKKLVVGFQGGGEATHQNLSVRKDCYCEKLECFKQAIAGIH